MSSVQTRYTSQYKQSPTHLWEFIAHFLYLLPFLADDGSVKTLFDDQVLCTLILLREKERESTSIFSNGTTGSNLQLLACELKSLLTMRDASSSSSFLASCTPWGSPSIRIRLLFSLSGGMRTVTLCSSLMRLTVNGSINMWFEMDADPGFVELYTLQYTSLCEQLCTYC